MDREQHAHRREVRDHRGAADAHERQRDAGDRRDAHRHADVHEDLEEQRDDDAARDDGAVEVSRHGDDPERPPQDEQVEREQHRRPDEAPLLAVRREDEVGAVLRQEVEAGLRRVLRPAPVELAGADRGDRLLEVVARVDRALLRMDETGEPRLLVRLEEVDADCGARPEDRDDREHGERAEDRELAPGRAGDEEHRSERGHVDECGAEIGLSHHEHDGDEAEPEHAHRRPDLPAAAGALREEAGDREDEEQLAELRRLERDHAEVDPACRASRRAAEDEHEEDERHGADEDRPPEPPVDVGVDDERDEERDDADADVDDLPVEVVVRVARQVEARDAGDRPEADRDEPADARDEQPVERAEDVDDRDTLAPLALKPCSLRSGVLEHQSSMVPVNRTCWGGSASP